MSRFKPHQEIFNIKPYRGGASVFAGVRNPVKLSSNESFFGASPKAIAAFKRARKKISVYPDNSALRLREKIGALYGLNPDQIICGNGSDDLLQLLARCALHQGDEAIHTQYGFCLYPNLIRAASGVPVAAPERNLRADIEQLLKKVSKKTRLVFLGNPNNPTGTYLSFDELKRLRRKLPQHILLVIDAAYAEYMNHDDYDSGQHLVDAHANVVMTRTFSKIYGLAGLRLGWAYAPRRIADALDRIRLPFNVSTPTLFAGIAALEDQAFIKKARSHNERWRRWMGEALGDMIATTSSANFLLLRFKNKKTAEAAWNFLGEHGLILRQMHEYRLSAYLRATIGSAKVNRKLVRLLKTFKLESR